MNKTCFAGKRILAVDSNHDALDVLEEKISEVCPKFQFKKATTFLLAVELMIFWAFDLVVLDFPGIGGQDLLDLTLLREIPVILLTATGLSSDKVLRSIKKGTSAILPKEKLEMIGPVLEDVLFQAKMTRLKYDFWRCDGSNS